MTESREHFGRTLGEIAKDTPVKAILVLVEKGY
jgi:hypothetical protein